MFVQGSIKMCDAKLILNDISCLYTVVTAEMDAILMKERIVRSCGVHSQREVSLAACLVLSNCL